jgi:hypothetical protein
MLLAISFGVISLFLSAVGIYGVLHFQVDVQLEQVVFTTSTAPRSVRDWTDQHPSATSAA